MTAAKYTTCKEYPVSPQGDQVSYPAYDCTWRPNVAFKATMTLTGMTRGMSAATYHWRSEDGRQWTMFLVDMEAVVKETVLSYGVATGWWRVRKRGKNFGIEYLGETYEVVA